VPISPVSPLADARVFALTGRTGSACEHLAQALKQTGRATLVGGVTGGAGHYGGERVFGAGRFQVFLPVGNSYAPGAESWEGVGVVPDRAVPVEEALSAVLREIGAPPEAAAAVPPLEQPGVLRVEGAPPNRRYGLMIAPPQGGEQFITIEDTAENSIARAAGLRPGDRIVAVNGRPISQMQAADFGSAMRASPMIMVVERNGQRLTFEMSLDG
jgi:C-terminal processing protease CtpA/Prc